MRLRIWTTLGVAVVLTTPMARVAAAQTPGPIIEHARIDLGTETVTITGQRFGTDPAVLLEAVPVAVVSASDNEIVVRAPVGALAKAGNSRLTVVDRKTGAGDVFIVTLGAAAVLPSGTVSGGTEAAAAASRTSAGATVGGATTTGTTAVTESVTGTTAVGYQRSTA